jgi:hypothetical protein
MCQPSLGVITFDWVHTQHNPFPDFNIQKQCVSHDTILNWQASHNVATQKKWDDISPPKDAYIRAASPELLVWEAAS